jgi:glutathione peroxidase
MRVALFLLLAACAAPKAAPAAAGAPSPTPVPVAAAPEQQEVEPVIDHTVESLAGKPVKLSDYRGSVLLIVNVASECGYTPQYAGLEKVYEKYADRGLVVIGFPSNDYGAQEPGSADEIQQFCEKNYGVKFPIMAKVHAKGPEKAPIYKTLTEETGEGIKGEVKWNFTKFLVDTNGKIVARFEPKVEPESAELTGAIEKLLPR